MQFSALTKCAAAFASALAFAASAGNSTVQAQTSDLSGEVTIWTWKTPGQGLSAAIPAFNKQYPNISVNVQDVGNPAIWDKITTGLAAGGVGLPDIMNVGIDYMGSYLERFPDSFVNLRTLGADDVKPEFAPGIWASGTGANDGVYGIPYEVSTIGVFYRKDLFELAGVDMAAIKTWDQLIDAGVAVKRKTGADLFAIDKANTNQQSSNLWQYLVAQQDSFLFDSEGNIAVNSPESVRALQLIKKANDLGLVADVPGSWENSIAQISGEVRVALFPCASWFAGVMPGAAPEMAGKWGVRLPPLVVEGSSAGGIVGGTYLSINAASEHKEAAWAFIKFALATIEGQKLVYGGGGLFPAYLPLIESKEFQAPLPFYGIDPVNELFVEQLRIPMQPINFTSDYAQGLKAQMDAQTRVLLNGVDPKAALDAAAQIVADQTGRQIRGQ